MKNYWLIPQDELTCQQLWRAHLVELTPAELTYLVARTLNDALCASLPPGDGTVHAAPFAPADCRVHLYQLTAKLQLLQTFLNPKNNESK